MTGLWLVWPIGRSLTTSPNDRNSVANTMICTFGPVASCIHMLEDLCLDPPKNRLQPSTCIKRKRGIRFFFGSASQASSTLPSHPSITPPRCMSRSLESFPKGSSISCQMDSSNISGWWYTMVYLPLWKIWVRQLWVLFPIYGKKKQHVPNHQTVLEVDTEEQLPNNAPARTLSCRKKRKMHIE